MVELVNVIYNLPLKHMAFITMTIHRESTAIEIQSLLIDDIIKMKI